MALSLPIYLDNHATTRTDPRVLECMAPWWSEDYGNAASRTHVFGWRAEEAVERARETLAGALGAEPREIVFTSGATESNNLALFGAAEAAAGRRDHVVSVATEHSAVLDPCRELERRGLRVSVLPVDGEGLVDPDAVRAAIGPRTLLVSVMAANNEIGVLQPIQAIGAVCRERGVYFHCDAAQAFGKIPLDVESARADLVSLSAHKLYGPKGVGALYVRARRPRVRLSARQHGGGHERGLRAGTLPVPLVVGFARAVELCLAEREEEARRLAALRDRLLSRVRGGLDGVVLNGHPVLRLPGNLNLSFEGVRGDELLLALKEVALSSGAACSSASPEPSHVLLALGRPEALVRASLRFGLGRFTTAEEIEFVGDRLIERVRELRASAPRNGARPPLP
jgi:cysteine desulfurase